MVVNPLSLVATLEAVPEKVTEAIDAAQLVLIRARRTIKTADKYQKQLFS